MLILFSFNQLKAEDRKNQLNKLFNELKINNTDLVYGTEQKIWEIWSTHPFSIFNYKDGLRDLGLVKINNLINAVDIFTEVIEKDPSWAEAWNKATVLYMLGDYQSSQNDNDKVLKLEDRHFGALAGQGLVNIKLKNYEKAIKSLNRLKKFIQQCNHLK